MSHRTGGLGNVSNRYTRRMREQQQITSAIRDNDLDLFKERISNLQLNWGNGKPPNDSYLWLDLLPWLCAIYNRPAILEHCAVIQYLLPKRGYGDIEGISFAEIMDYQDCLNLLVKLYPCIYNRQPPIHLAKQLLYLDIEFNMIDTDIFKMSCKRLLGNRINELNKFGQTFLHEEIFKCMSNEKMSALLEIGCDINVLDRQGNTAFLLFCQPHYVCCPTDSYSTRRRPNELPRKLELLIMENPSVKLSDSADYHILRYEIAMFIQKQKRYPSDSELLSFPLTTLLHKHGFDFSNMTYDELSRETKINRGIICSILPELKEREQTILNKICIIYGVRKLTEICRIVLRRHYPGKAIHTFVRGENVPKQLKDYILLKDMIQL